MARSHCGEPPGRSSILPLRYSENAHLMIPFPCARLDPALRRRPSRRRALPRDLPRFLRTPISLEHARDKSKSASLRARTGWWRWSSRGVRPSCIPVRGAAPSCRPASRGRGQRWSRAMASKRRSPALLRAGVYLTVDELKGADRWCAGPRVHGRPGIDRQPALRRSRPRPRPSGSGGPSTPVPIDLASIADHAVNTQLALEAHGGREWRHAHYGVPGGTAVTNPLELAKSGRPPDRWFTPIELDDAGPERALPARIGRAASRQRRRGRSAAGSDLRSVL